MPNQLQAASEVMERLLEPAHLAQISVIASMVVLGWWIARRIRRDLGAANAPAGGGDGHASRLGRGAHWADAAVARDGRRAAACDRGADTHRGRRSPAHRSLAADPGDRLPVPRVARHAFADQGLGTPISGVIWIFLSLHLLGWGDTLIGVLDGIGITAGKTRISVWSITKLLVTVGLFVVIAVWVSRWLEKRLMALQGIAHNMRIGLAKFTQAFLVGCRYSSD
jgi:hypothetical protein